MKNKKLLTIFGIILLITIVTAGVIDIALSSRDIQTGLTTEQLAKIGIGNFEDNSPVISECISQGDTLCVANVYQSGAINKDIQVTTKYCDKYKIEFYDGECLIYDTTSTNGDCLVYENQIITNETCINWIDENKTECLEYEQIILEGDCIEYEQIIVNGDCIEYNILNKTTDVCEKWKVLTQEEIYLTIDSLFTNLTNEIYNVKLEREARINVPEIKTDAFEVNV